MFPNVLRHGYLQNLSNSAAEDKHSKLYELRQYNIYPQHMKPFLELSVQGLVIRTKFSKLIGYWSAELGGLNQVVHIWEYGKKHFLESYFNWMYKFYFLYAEA